MWHAEGGRWQIRPFVSRRRRPPARRRTLARAALQVELHEVAPLGQAASISVCAPSRAVNEDTVPTHEAGRAGNWARAAPRQPSATSSRRSFISKFCGGKRPRGCQVAHADCSRQTRTRGPGASLAGRRAGDGRSAGQVGQPLPVALCVAAPSELCSVMLGPIKRPFRSSNCQAAAAP